MHLEVTLAVTIHAVLGHARLRHSQFRHAAVRDTDLMQMGTLRSVRHAPPSHESGIHTSNASQPSRSFESATVPPAAANAAAISARTSGRMPDTSTLAPRFKYGSNNPNG